MSVLLEIDDVSIRFGGLSAVDKVTMSVEQGTIVGIIGPNGAGKTTMFNIITGILTPTSGRIRLGGRDITALPPHRRARRGLSRTFQRLEVFGTLTVRENVLVAAEARRRWERGVKPQILAEDLLDRFELTAVAETTVDSLPTGTQRLVEMARALAAGPKLLLLDEASSGLSSFDTESIATLLRRLVDEDGLTVVLVEHDMPFVMGLSDTVAMLDHGKLVAHGSPAEVQAMETVQAAYLGSGAR